jgi:serine/threonine protein kinase
MADWLEPQEPTATASPSAWPACPPPRDPQAPLAPGSRVDRYEVIELLGEGSMGAVYLAHDLDLGREVALKRIKPGRVDLWRAQTRLHREAQTMARIEHAAVVRVYSVGIADGQLFIAMELARGGSVAAWARASRRSWRDVISVFVDAGRGLAAAHRAGIVHRDIKPSNLLIDSHGRAKVSDFGVARVLEGGGDDGSRDDDDDARGAMAPGATHTGGVVGTLEYMPPERSARRSILVLRRAVDRAERPAAVSARARRVLQQFARAVSPRDRHRADRAGAWPAWRAASDPRVAPARPRRGSRRALASDGRVARCARGCRPATDDDVVVDRGSGGDERSDLWRGGVDGAARNR